MSDRAREFRGQPRHEPAQVEAEHQAEMQACIDRVLDRCRRQPVPEIREALAAEFGRHGHPAQPESWLEAVAEEAAAGRRYVVGTTVHRPDAHATDPGRSHDRDATGG